MNNQDFGIPLGTAVASAFTPLTLVAGLNSIRGQAARDLFLERGVIVGNAALAGLVNDLRVMKQSCVPSSKGFPVQMLAADAFDDEACSLGLTIEGGTFIDIDYVAPAAEAGQLIGGIVGTMALPDGVPAGQNTLDEYSFIFGLGENVMVGAGQWVLEAQGLRDILLGRICIQAPAGWTVESIEVAGAELFSGDGAVLASLLDARSTDTDGLTLGKLLSSGESVVIKGQALGAGTVTGGIYLSDVESLV